MSFPNIPDVSPTIDISTEDFINLILASIAFEELGLAHIINSEAEKIQFVLGTIEGQTPLETPPTVEDLIEIDKSVERTLRDVIKTQMLLQFKLEEVITFSTTTTASTTTTTTSSTTTTTSSTTTTTSSTTTTTSSTTTTTSSTTTTTSSTTTTTSSTTTTTSSTTTTTSSTTTTTSSTTTTTSSTTTTTSSTTTTTSSTTTTTSSTTTTTSSTTTTSTTSTTTTTTKQPEDVGSAWSVGTDFGHGNAQYTTLDPGVDDKTVTLGLGKNHDPVGTVHIVRTGNNLAVTISTVFPYTMSENQLYVDDIAPTDSNPGGFPYQYVPGVFFMSHTFNVDISGLSGTIYIAAHATIFQFV